jgi:4-amino-4-deoxy-L-arabinose transferase-like glycosyltransferase
MFALSGRDKGFLGLLFLISFLIRAAVYGGYLSKNQNYWQVDSSTYHLVAQGIDDGKGISLPGGQPNFYRLPGYPLFMAFIYKIVGQNPQKALWGQIFLGAFIPLLIFFLAGILFNRRWLAWLAGSFGAIHLGLILYSGFYMTETLFIFLFLLFAIFFFSYLGSASSKELDAVPLYAKPLPSWWFFTELTEEGTSFSSFYPDTNDFSGQNAVAYLKGDEGFKKLFLAGVFLGLASLVRPVGHYLILLALVLIMVRCVGWKCKINRTATLFISWLIPVSFWLVRNYLLLGHLFFHTLPGGHFLYLSAARVVAEAQDRSYPMARLLLSGQVDQMIRQEEHIKQRPLTEIERCWAHEALARKYFKRYPLISIKLWLTDMFRTCFSLYSAELLYLDSGRKQIEYFDKARTMSSWFSRYLNPATENGFLKGIIYYEIISFFLLLLGFAIGLVLMIVGWLRGTLARQDVHAWLYVLPFMALFIVVALAGGYARMRLPMESFLIILSLWGWGQVLCRHEGKQS